MRHQLSRSPLQLTPDEVRQFLQLAQAHRSPQALARRARIVLTAHAHPTWRSKQIAQVLNLDDRWYASGDDAGTKPIRSQTLPDQERPVVSPLMCALKSRRWRAAYVALMVFPWLIGVELGRHVAATPSMPAISASTIGRWLAAEQIRPWRYHPW